MIKSTSERLKRLVDLHKQAYTPLKDQEVDKKRQAQDKQTSTLGKLKR